jgi:diketogulonate reductase-like aldo/keto reductase
MRTLNLPSGRPVPVLGQGTWRMGENSAKRSSEIRAIQLGIDLGLTLIDTAEMYANGESEELVGEAITGRREEVFLVSKVYPHRDYGVSNFDAEDMKEAISQPGGVELATNQVLYNLMRRGIEWDLLPWCRQRGIPIMAYSPIEQGRLSTKLEPLAVRRGVSPAQIALAWLLQQGDVIAIPKASDSTHVRDNRAALDLFLTDNEISELDRLFPAPRVKKALEMY